MEDFMKERAAGVLLHISSLPGRYGIGTLGRSAYRFVDLLAGGGIRYWQILPLVQTGFGDSPYQSVFSGSGNPYFIDPEILAKEKLLTKEELSAYAVQGARVDYSSLYQTRYEMLRLAFSRFDTGEEQFRSFVQEGTFDGYALFMALKEDFGGEPFSRWPAEYKFAKKRSLQKFKEEHGREYLFWQFVQYQFEKQWRALKNYANEHGVRIIGDIPLYVAYDSADVWLNPSLFKLNSDRSMQKVAGVPPDCFSATGQLWGNPVYRWSAHRREKYAWWIGRLRQAFIYYDVIRVDHFRGFDRYYEIEAGAETAERGRWCRGPKAELFRAAEEALGRLPVIAEDLGLLDAGVRRLLADTGYPGMKVLQFAFDGNRRNTYLPKYIPENSVCYTGTHDNDTTLGYVRSLRGKAYSRFLRQLQGVLREEGLSAELPDKRAAAAAIVRLALHSRAKLAVIPVQDILLLGSDARMNTPSTVGCNWEFRLQRLPKREKLQILRI